MGRESDQPNQAVEKADAVALGNENHQVDWQRDGSTLGKGINQQIGLVNESASTELVKQGTLPTVDLVADGDKPMKFAGGLPGADGVLRFDEKDTELQGNTSARSASSKPQFAGHPDGAGPDVLQVNPLQALPPLDLSTASSKPQFAGHPDGAGPDLLRVNPLQALPRLTDLPAVSTKPHDASHLNSAEDD